LGDAVERLLYLGLDDWLLARRIGFG